MDRATPFDMLRAGGGRGDAGKGQCIGEWVHGGLGEGNPFDAVTRLRQGYGVASTATRGRGKKNHKGEGAHARNKLVIPDPDAPGSGIQDLNQGFKDLR